MLGRDMATPSPLIITQILAPKKRPDLLHRPRLVDFVHEHIDRKLLLISASAGYGKTSLLVDYAYDTDLPLCWLSVIESARDPRVFLDYLIAAISQHFPEFGQRSRRLLRGSETLTDPALLVGTLVNEIYETIPDYFVVAVDDYHLVDSSRAVNLVLDTLIQHLPENCHFIISSRAVPTLTPRGLALLTSRQEIAGLGVKDLKFTPEEIQALLLQNYGQRLPDEAARELAEKSEGWITGILLTTHTMWKGLFEGIIRIEGSDSKVYDYLANEVFSLQAPALQNFLLSTSILEEMSPLLCDELLEISNSRETLKLLEEKNLFISRLERGEERWYRYHHLFRQFLWTKLQEAYPQQIRLLHQRAAGLLRESGAVEQAIGHYLTAEDYGNAIEAILAIAQETYDAGKLETLARWIDALPPEMVQARPRLLWFRAKVHLEVGELDQATRFFDRAYTEFAARGNLLGQAQTLVEKSAVRRFQGEFREAIDGCEQAISLVQTAKARTDSMRVTASARRQIGTCQANLGNLSAGEAQLRQALGTYEQMGYETNIAYVHNDLGVILRLAGNLTGSELHFRQALEIWENIGNIGMAALTLNNIAVGHYFRGEYAEALQLYQVGLDQARKAGLDRPMAFILAGIGDIHCDQGAYAEALETYEEGLKAARQSRENFIICYLLNAIGNAYRLTGDYPLAIDLVRQAYERATERESTYEMGLYQTSLGVIHYQQGNIRQAEEYLSQARDIFMSSNAKREVAKASLYLGQAYYVAGRFQEALDCVQEVLGCLLELGYDEFLLPVARETRRVIEYAAEREMGDTLISHLLRKADALAAAGPDTSTQEEPAVIQPLLRVYAFGENRVLRGDELITSAEWGMAKSKELLFYLLCHSQRRKDQIGNDLWAELSPAKLRSSFHVALYRLRRALDQQDCVKYEDDQYFFNRRINYWFDVQEFELAHHEATLAWKTDRDKAAQHYRAAIVLYRGDFLEDLTSSHEWCLFKREELLQKYLLALRRLGEYHAATGNYRDAIGCYDKVLQKDSYQESAHRETMRCEALLGNRSAALKRYHRLAEFLEKELGAGPAPATTALYEQILQGKITPD
jgi:LuxR family maltose regulon positive regulatory protein